MLSTLIPVIVGGVIGLLGGLAGPPLGQFLNQRAARAVTPAAKLEELMGALYAYDNWLAVVANARVFLGKALAEEPSPMARARAIAAVHFPDLDLLLTELELAGRHYEVWMLTKGSERLKSGADYDPNAGMQEAYGPALGKFSEVMKTLKAMAAADHGLRTKKQKAPPSTLPPPARPRPAPRTPPERRL